MNTAASFGYDAAVILDMCCTNLGDSKHWLDDDVQTLQGHRPYDPDLLPRQELRKRNRLCLEESYFLKEAVIRSGNCIF